MSDLFVPLTLPSSVIMKNRFVLAPLINCQSHEDGRLSEEEFRAGGGFAFTSIATALVQASGKGFVGQLGIIATSTSRAVAPCCCHPGREQYCPIQLHHSGTRSVSALTGIDPVAPSAHAKYGARTLPESEIEQAIADFITAAERASGIGNLKLRLGKKLVVTVLVALGISMIAHAQETKEVILSRKKKFGSPS